MKKSIVGKKRKLVLVESFGLNTKAPIVQEESKEDPKMKAYNEEFIDVLGELAGILQRQGEPFKARAYQKGQESIMTRGRYHQARATERVARCRRRDPQEAEGVYGDRPDCDA